MFGNINWLWLAVGLALGYFVAPRIVGPVMGKVAEVTGGSE